MFTIHSITYRKVLNSHVKFTNEFIIVLEDGSIGRGTSSQGETISIYEDKKISIDPDTIIRTLEQDNLLGIPIDQVGFDEYLMHHLATFGRNNAFGLSEAFFDACLKTTSIFELLGRPHSEITPPLLCLNILNGGWHAYTNPVLSDFSEFILVAKSNNLSEVIGEHNEIQRVVKEKQARQEKTVISGNPVNCFSTRDNRECIEFLLNVCESLGLANKYELMIDASAGDLWNGEKYCLGVTDNSLWSSDEFLGYWMDLIHQYHLGMLEDPFHEKDFATWQLLTTMQQDCRVIGDNLYSSDTSRITEGVEKHYAHGVVIKPNQAGTVTTVCQALKTAKTLGQIPITSHRSISTESVFLSILTCLFSVPFIKIGPLMTDYSSVVRLNEIIRLTEVSI